MISAKDSLPILKSLELFSETPEASLLEIANVLLMESYTKNEKIIEEGEPGTCLYIVYSGKVFVHFGEHKVAEVGEKQTFGEFSLLNSDPRNASISALEDCVLLRLEQIDFYRIMGSNNQFMRGIIRILIRRLGEQNSELIQTLKQREVELTRLVAERTSELEFAMKEIQEQKVVLEKSYEEILNQKLEIEEKNQNITESIRYAHNIQLSILPNENTIKSALPNSFIYFKPRDVVSGDFYWFYEFKDADESKIVIAAIDCTGHGVPGALMSMIGNGLLNDIVKVRKILDPGLILNELHKGVRVALNQEQTDLRDGMDMALCVIDRSSRQLQFAGAMNSIFYIQDDCLNEIKGNRKSIGGTQSEESRIFSTNTIELNRTTSFYICSDGYFHQFGGEFNKKFSTKKFKDLLLEIHPLEMNLQKLKLQETMSDWIGDRNQIDDMLVIGVRV
jgi:CRP-like cAMP-binding protein